MTDAVKHAKLVGGVHVASGRIGSASVEGAVPVAPHMGGRNTDGPDFPSDGKRKGPVPPKGSWERPVVDHFYPDPRHLVLRETAAPQQASDDSRC